MYWTLLCGEHSARHGGKQKENEVLLELSSKSWQSCLGVESIHSAKIAVTGRATP